MVAPRGEGLTSLTRSFVSADYRGVRELRMPHLPLHRDTTLDPPDWASFRDQGHRMLDDMFDYLENIRQRPVWQPMPGCGSR